MMALPAVELERRCREWRRQSRFAVGIEGAARLAAAEGAAWLGASLLDSLAPFTIPVRWATFALLAAAALAGVLLWIVLPVRKEGAKEVLRAVCGKRPGLSAYLLTAWELALGRSDGRTSEALARAHIEETERRLSGLSSAPVFPLRLGATSRRGLAVLAAGWAAAAPWLYRSGADPLRIWVPWKEVPIESFVAISPGSARFPWGSAASIRARTQRPAAEAGLDLWLKDPQSPWSRASWDEENGSEFSYRIPELVRPVWYQIRRKGRRSRIYVLEPVPYPRLEQVVARAYPPRRRGASGGVPAAESSLEETGEVSALRGSWIVVAGRASQPLARARLRVSALEAPVEMRPRNSGRYEAGFPLAADGEFYFELVSRDGFSDPHPAQYRLKALADRPPTAEILSPAFDVEISNRENLAVAYEVQDDHGVASVELAYRTPRGPEKRLPIARFAPPAPDSAGEYSWDLSGFPVGERVEFWIRAADASAAGAQIGLSSRRAARIVDFEAMHADMENKWIAAEKKIAVLAQNEAAALRLLESMARAPGGEETAAQKRSWRGLDPGLAAQWDEAGRGLSDAAQAMSQDPFANPGLEEELRALAENFKALQSLTLPRASRQARERDWAAAAKSHADLESEADKARRLMARGRGLQALQDLWSEAGRMDQAGMDLSSLLAEAARRPGGASEKERRGLLEALGRLQGEMQALARAVEALPEPPAGSEEERRRRTVVVPLGSARRLADALGKALESGDDAAAARIAGQLSEELARVRQALADAASWAGSAGGAQGGGEAPVSAELESLLGEWRQALEGQSRSVGLAQRFEDEKVQSMIEEEKRLLARLEARQRAVLDRALRLGAAVPGELEVSMRAALDEFVRREARRAPQLLAEIAGRLDALAAFAARANAPDLAALAAEERAILSELQRGAPPARLSAGQASQASSAREAQARVRRQTAELERRLRELEGKTSAIPPAAGIAAGEARQAQSEAEESLGRGDASSALSREEKALELLDRGMKELASALERQRNMERSLQSPFASPRGGRPMRPRGAAGAETGSVTLPSARDYRPTPDIRKELEKSAREPRPRSYDRIIKDYFKRISE